MINLFRKIRKKTLENKKIANYSLYAFGEIILVVIGILLALYINNLNEISKERTKEKAILKQLHNEFKKNYTEFKLVKNSQIKTYNSGDIVLKNITKLDNKKSRDSVFKYSTRMFGGYTYYPSNGVVESLISSGEINLIQNDTLRKYLVSWKDVLTQYNENVSYDQKLWSNNIEPYIIKNGDFLTVSNPKNKALLTDPVFINMVVRKQFFQKNIINSIIGKDGLEHYLKEIVRLSKPNN